MAVDKSTVGIIPKETTGIVYKASLAFESIYIYMRFYPFNSIYINDISTYLSKKTHTAHWSRRSDM